MSESKKRSSEEVAGLLQKAHLKIVEGTPIKEACKAHGVFDSQYFKWRKIALKKRGKYKRTAKVTSHTFPLSDRAEGTVSISGTPSALARFFREVGANE